MKLILRSVLFCLVYVVFLTSCGGGGGGSENDALTGAFIDAPVKGLKFSSQTQQGQTDTEGRFQYRDGETVTFKIGGMSIGSAQGKQIISPVDLVSETNAPQSLKVTNIVRLLLTLDEDNNPDNGISISDKANTRAANLLTPFQELNQFNLLNNADLSEWLSSLGKTELVAANEAQEHLQTNLDILGVSYNPDPAYQACENITCSSSQVCFSGSCFELCTDDNADNCFDAESSTDVCTGISCGVGKVCYGGSCFPSCVGEQSDQCLLNSTDQCDGVICGNDQACYDGACISQSNACDSVLCLAGEVCFGGGCFPDGAIACSTVQCEANEACYDGLCYGSAPSCDGVLCASGEVCYGGSCFDYMGSCSDVICQSSQVCVGGSCFDNAASCSGVTCNSGQICVSGSCFEDQGACSGVTCTSGTSCSGGICLADNGQPVANAGNDVTLFEGDLVSLSASSSTDDTGIVSYDWKLDNVSQGTGSTLDLSTYATGNYVFTLTVADAQGLDDTDTVNVTVNDSKYIFTISLSGTSTSFEVPTLGIGYNYSIDCNNDGNFESTGETGNYICNYANPGVYQVAIDGDFPQINFRAEPIGVVSITYDCPITEVNNWGNQQWRSMIRAFFSCDFLSVLPTVAPDLSNVTDMTGMFQNAKEFNQNINGWNVSSVTKMDGVFYGARIFNQPLSNWDVSNVTSMVSMFFNAQNFNQNIGAWSVGNVVDMAGMFSSAKLFNQNISGWNVGKVASMQSMFSDAQAFDQNIGGWDISNVTNMGSMFQFMTLSTSNYDGILNGWATNFNGIQNNVNFHAGDSLYSTTSDAARATLQGTHFWSITDGGSI